MLFLKPIFTCVLIGCCFFGWSQNHRTQKERVKESKAKVKCPVFDASRYPFQGIGVKLGDPFAVTYKFYLSKNFSLAADAGRAASSLYNSYLKEKFNSYTNPDTLSAGSQLIYLNHKVNADYIGELKVLYHFNTLKASRGLQVYFGAGWEWKRTTLTYNYLHEHNFNHAEAGDNVGAFKRTRLTHGPQGVFGIEYSYFNIPISAFLELEYFYDIQLDPGWKRAEGGVGLRYIFK